MRKQQWNILVVVGYGHIISHQVESINRPDEGDREIEQRPSRMDILPPSGNLTLTFDMSQ